MSLCPATPEDALSYVLDAIDLVLVMTVNPGFGGQSFLPSQLPKNPPHPRDDWGPATFISNSMAASPPQNAGQCFAAGADVLVAGSARCSRMGRRCTPVISQPFVVLLHNAAAVDFHAGNRRDGKRYAWRLLAAGGRAAVARRTPTRSNPVFCPLRDTAIRFPSQFYLIAMFFMIFDLEMVFVFAWAVAVRPAGWAGYGGMLVFLALLLVALAYLWRSGALEWGPAPRHQNLTRRP